MGAKLYYTLSRARTYIDHKSMAVNSSSDDKDIILQQLHQILSKLPAWTRTLKVQHLKEKAKSSTQLVMELCTAVNNIVREMQDLSLTVDVPLSRTVFSCQTGQTETETCEQDNSLEAMIWRVNERLEGYEGLSKEF